MKAQEQQDLIDAVSQDIDVLVYQGEIKHETKQYSWFRRVIIDPILKPLLEKIFAEYLETVVRATINALIAKGKL